MIPPFDYSEEIVKAGSVNTLKQSHSLHEPTVSLCMIVKNEEELLPRCLESVKDVVDEMIIVDTGSTDRTVEIAKSYGAQVYHHRWQDSFSEARNYGLQFATGDWIFQIDADEELEQEDIPLLRRALRSDLYNAILVAIYNHFPSGRSKHYFERIFHRNKAHYEGIVHNQLIVEGDSLATEIRLYHYGYDLSEEDMARKYRRTRDLLLRQIEEDPDDTFARSNLVRIYRCWKMFDKAIEEGEKALALDSPKMLSHHYQMICSDTAYCLFATGQNERAEELCWKVLEENPDNLDVLFTLGGIYIKKGEYQEAMEQFQKFLKVKREEEQQPKFTLLQVDTYSYEDRAWNNIGMCYKNMGCLDKAIEAFQRAIELNEKEAVYYCNLAYAYIEQNRLNEAEETFSKAVDLGIADDTVHFGYLKLGILCITLKEYSRAIELLERYLKFAPTDHRVLTDLATCYAKLGQYEAALIGYRTVLKINPRYEQAIRNLTALQRRLRTGKLR